MSSFWNLRCANRDTITSPKVVLATETSGRMGRAGDEGKGSNNCGMPKSLASGGKLHKYNLTKQARALRNCRQTIDIEEPFAERLFLPK